MHVLQKNWFLCSILWFCVVFFYFSKQVCQYLYCGLIMLPAMSNELNIRTENLPSHVMAG